jgi:tRNA dimethylallyltransferase
VTAPLLALVGPTASGKTAIAVELAEEFGAEIVCVDSMTIYRGMNIGTAKPDTDSRSRAPHHLLDIAAPGERPGVAEFRNMARETIEGIRARERLPLVVGGSGLYFRAVVDALDFPPADPAVRARLQQEPADLLAIRLKELDPDAAEFVDPANKRRVVRALEVIEITGRPFSSFRDAWDRYLDVAVAGLEVSPDVLRARIERRLQDMFARGFVDEVRELVSLGYRDALMKTKAVGYQQVIQHLEGSSDLTQALEQAARATWRLSRRQMSWFSKDPRVVWFEGDDLERATREVRAYYKERLEGI